LIINNMYTCFKASIYRDVWFPWRMEL